MRGASLDASRARAWFEGTGREGPHRAAAQDGLTLSSCSPRLAVRALNNVPGSSVNSSLSRGGGTSGRKQAAEYYM